MLKPMTVPLSGVESVVRLDQAHEQVTLDCVTMTINSNIAAALDEDTLTRNMHAFCVSEVVNMDKH